MHSATPNYACVLATQATFYHWAWMPGDGAAVAPLLEQLPGFEFNFDALRLTDGLLGEVLGMAIHVGRVDTDTLQLTTAVHASQAWPWRELKVYNEIDLSMLLRLPSPAEAGAFARPVLRCNAMTLKEFLSQVSSLHNTRIDRKGWKPAYTHTIPADHAHLMCTRRSRSFWHRLMPFITQQYAFMGSVCSM